MGGPERQGFKASQWSFESVVVIHCLYVTALDLRAGVEQTFGCLSTPSGGLDTVAASNNRGHTPWSPYCSVFTQHTVRTGAIHSAYPVRIASRMRRRPTGRLQQHTPFYNAPHRSTNVLYAKIAPGMALASWSQQDFVAVGKPERQVRQSCTHTHCGSKQQ